MSSQVNVTSEIMDVQIFPLPGLDVVDEVVPDLDWIKIRFFVWVSNKQNFEVVLRFKTFYSLLNYFSGTVEIYMLL